MRITLHSMKTRWPKVNPILHGGVKTDLRSHASRSARREDELPMIVKIDLHRVQLRVHDAACSPARRRKPGLHATETRLHREKVGWGHAKDRRIDAGDRPATL
jgi:hypothetical protein